VTPSAPAKHKRRHSPAFVVLAIDHE
jgi:hypothetical protein